MNPLRLPELKLSAIFVVSVQMAVFWFAYPRSSRDMGWLAMEVVVTYGTLLVAAVSTGCAVAFLGRPKPAIAAWYSWSAVAVLAGDVSLALLGYWQKALKDRLDHYALSWVVAGLSILALLPAIMSAIRRER